MRRLIPLLILLLLTAISVTFVHADGCDPEFIADFGVSISEDYGFVELTGTAQDHFDIGNPGDSFPLEAERVEEGWTHSSGAPCGTGCPAVAINYHFETPYDLCTAQATEVPGGSGNAARYILIYALEFGESEYTLIGIQTSSSGLINAVATWEGSMQITDYAVVAVTFPHASDTVVTIINNTKLNLGIEEESIIIKKPIIAADEHPLRAWSASDYTDDNDIMVPMANINFQAALYEDTALYNIQDGEVIEVDEIDAADCNEYTGFTIPAGYCEMMLTQAQFAANSGEIGVYQFVNSYQNIISQVSYQPITRVRVSSVDSTITYLLQDVRADVGMNIVEGCRLGTAVYLNEISADTETSPQGAAVLGYSDSVDDLTDGFVEVELVDYVSPIEEDCNVAAEYKDCLTINPFFAEDGEYWQSTSSIYQPVWNNPGVTLGAHAGIKLPSLELDPDTEYGASLSGKSFSWSGANLTIEIGTTTQTVSLTDTTQTYTIPAEEYDPDDGLLYTVKLINNGSTAIDIDYFCLTEGAPQMTQCIFENADFRYGLDHWEVSAGVELVGLERPLLKVSNGDSIYQNIYLPPGSYDLELTYQIPIPLVSTSYVIDYEFNDITVTGDISLNSSTASTQTAIEPIEIVTDPEEVLSQVFLFEVSGADPSSIFYITKICLNPSDGEDGEGGGEDLTDPSCLYNPAMPDEADIGTALQWHWGQISRLYNCKVIPILKSIDKGIKDIYVFLGRQFQWGMHLAFKTVQWLGTDLLPWLAGYMSNVAPGTVIVNPSESPPGTCQAFDLVCFLSGIINNFVDGIIGTFNNALTVFGNTLTTGLNTLSSIVRDSIGPLSGVFTTIIDRLADIIITLIDRLADVFIVTIDKSTDIIRDVVFQVSNVLQSLFYNLSDLFQVIVSELGNILRALFNALLELLKLIADTIIKPVMDTVVYLIRQIIDHFLVPLFGIILQFLDMALQLILLLAVTLIRLGLTLITRIFEIAQYGLQILSTMLNAWISAPEKTLPQLPDCSADPDAGLCQVWWMLDNTILSGPGALIIPLFTSAGWILLFIYLARELRAAVLKTAGNFI